MSDLTLILLAAGNSSRFSLPVKKQWLRVDHDPLWHFVTSQLEKSGLFKEIVIAAHREEVSIMKSYTDHLVVEGGATRQQSLRHALAHVTTPYVLVSDIARSCIDTALIERIIAQKTAAECIVPYLSVTDTVVFENTTIRREDVKRIQTPQLSSTAFLKKALATDTEYTDESSAIVAAGGSRHFVEGHEDAHKITFAGDLAALPCLKGPSAATLSGNGFDVHAYEEGREMWLGGVKIDAPYGFKAHSDGDVAIHALIDALLGAAGMGDIGMLFPDTVAAYAGIDSKILLERTVTRLQNFGYVIVNADITIAAQAPKLSPYKDEMRRVLSRILQLPAARLNVKATTTEELGFVGRKEGAAVMASVSLNYFDWTQQ